MQLFICSVTGIFNVTKFKYSLKMFGETLCLSVSHYTRVTNFKNGLVFWAILYTIISNKVFLLDHLVGKCAVKLLSEIYYSSD